MSAPDRDYAAFSACGHVDCDDASRHIEGELHRDWRDQGYWLQREWFLYDGQLREWLDLLVEAHALGGREPLAWSAMGAS